MIIQDVNNMFIANAELELFDQDNKLVWSGTTDQDGKGLFNMTFSNENYTKMWKLEVSSEGLNISKEVGFLTSTPILLTLPKPAEEEPATAGFPIEVLVIGVLLATGVLIIIIKRKKSLNAG